MNRRAGDQASPFACFRLIDSQKAPYFVHLADLAQALDKSHASIKADHHALHS